MTKTNKKKNQIVLFLLAFVTIAIVTLVVNYRSTVAYQLANPQNGVEKLFTSEEHLIALSPRGDVYIWNWNNLSDQPQIVSVNIQKAVVLSHDRLIGLAPGTNNVLVSGNLKGDNELKRLLLGLNIQCKRLQANPSGKYAVVAMETDNDVSKDIQLALADSNLVSISPVIAGTLKGNDLKLRNITISNDGTLVVAVGSKGAGWILLANSQTRQILWEQNIDNTKELNNVIFSPDAKSIYASEAGRTVFVFETDTGKILKQLIIDEYKTPPNNPQTISCIVLSPDGRLFAASSSPVSKVWIWRTNTGQKITNIGTGSFSTSTLSFSPDASLLAGADLTNKPIKVWKVPKIP